jgi:hypothetical protein
VKEAGLAEVEQSENSCFDGVNGGRLEEVEVADGAFAVLNAALLLIAAVFLSAVIVLACTFTMHYHMFLSHYHYA